MQQNSYSIKGIADAVLVLTTKQNSKTKTSRLKLEEEFGFALRNFLDAFYSAKRNDKKVMVQEEPPLLRTVLRDKGVADAYLAALANHLSNLTKACPPYWARREGNNRLPDKAWFSMKSPEARAWLLTQSPAAFRERNLFISSDGLSRV